MIEGAQPTLSSDSASQQHAICSQLYFVTSPGKHTSSKDPSITNLIVVTSFVCPILCTRASACSSTVGFHWGSIMYTLDAAVMSRLCSVSDILEQKWVNAYPTDAQDIVMRMTDILRSLRKLFSARVRLDDEVLPS